MIDPLSVKPTEHGTWLRSLNRTLQGLYTFTSGNEYITLGLPPQVTQNPGGTPLANTLYAGLIPKAWIRFNMATDAIGDSLNVSSITDGAAGIDTINWDRDFASGNYAISGAAVNDAGNQTLSLGYSYSSAPAAGSCQIMAFNPADVLTDADVTGVVAFGAQ